MNGEKKILVLSGGSSGIGSAIADKMRNSGWLIFSIDTQLPVDSAHIPIFQGDISLAEDVEEFYRHVSDRTAAAPAALVLNAGVVIHERLAEGDPEKWDKVIRTNLLGNLRLVRAFLPLMLEGGEGDVVFISSLYGSRPYEYGGIYIATKAALNAIADTLRLEVQPPLRVTVIEPGVVETDFFQSLPQSVASIDYGALKSEDIADTVHRCITSPNHIAYWQIRMSPIGQNK